MLFRGQAVVAWGVVGRFFGAMFTSALKILITLKVMAVNSVFFVVKMTTDTSNSSRCGPSGGAIFGLSLSNILISRTIGGPFSRLVKRDDGRVTISSIVGTVHHTGTGSGVGNVCLRTNSLSANFTKVRTVHHRLRSFGSDNGFVISCNSCCARKTCCLYDMTSSIFLGPRNDISLINLTSRKLFFAKLTRGVKIRRCVFGIKACGDTMRPFFLGGFDSTGHRRLASFLNDM